MQLARLHGAYVIATASPERVEAARMFGADQVIDHTTADLSAIEPADVVFDTVGGDRLANSISIVAPGGRLVSVAENPPLEPCAERGVTGIFFVVEPDRRRLAEVARLADQGLLRVLIDRIYRLSEAQEAFEHSLNRGGRGKVVLTLVED